MKKVLRECSVVKKADIETAFIPCCDIERKRRGLKGKEKRKRKKRENRKKEIENRGERKSE
jgi:hypothetical protein